MEYKETFPKDEIKQAAGRIKKPKAYEKKEFAQPGIDLPVSQKNTKEYAIKWCERIFSLYKSGKSWTTGISESEIDLMRSYADGGQPTDQYKNFIFGDDKQTSGRVFDGSGFDTRDLNASAEEKRKAWINLNFKPVSVGPKMMTKINEHVRSLYYEMNLNAVDSISTRNEEIEKYKLWFWKQNKEWLNGQYAKLGIQEENPDFEPINLNELELYASTGGFKSVYATNMEALLKHTFDISDWDKEIKERVVKDLCTIGYSMVRNYYDGEEMREKVKYVDAKFGGVQHSATNSFKDSEIGYELEWWEISKAMRVFGFSREQAASLAFAYSGEHGNPSEDKWVDFHHYDGESRVLGFDFYKVPVFRCEWVDIDNEKYVEHITASGRKITKPYKEGSSAEPVNSPVRYVREATWIVGTQYVTEFGKAKHIPRINPKKPRVSYRAVKLLSPSLFRQISPLLDGLQNAWLKTQQAIAIAVSNGLAVDVGALKNISIGKDKTWDVTEVLRYYRQQSILLYKKGNQLNMPSMGGGNVPPVTPLITRMFENIKAQFEVMDKFMQQIEAFSGMNLVAMGETPDPGLGKFNMQAAIAGTNQILNSITRAITDLQSDVSENIICKIRSYVRTDDKLKASYSEVIGEHRLKSIVDAERNHVEYGIKIEARDIAEMKAFIDAILAASIKSPSPAEEGKLDVSEAIQIKDMLDQKQNIRRISLIVGYLLKKKQINAQQMSLKKIELQGQQLQNVEAVKEQATQKARMHEVAMAKQKFEYDFILKFGQPPSAQQVPNNGAMQQPPQAQQPMQQGMPQEAQPAMAASV